MPELIEAVRESLDDLGLSLGMNEDVIIKKCASLCEQYELDAEGFANTWIAFAASNAVMEVNEETLATFERQELSTRAKDKTKVLDETLLAEIQMKSKAKSRVEVYGASNTFIDVDSDNDIETGGDFDLDPDSDVLRAYGLPSASTRTSSTVTPKREKKPQMRLRPNTEGTTNGDFSPAGFSPAVGSKSTSYSSRAKAGDTVLRYKCKDSDYWDKIPANNESVIVIPAQATKSQLESDANPKYMFQKTTDMAATLNDALLKLGLDMVSNEEKTLEDLRESAMDGWYLGKICSTEMKLTEGSTYLEGDEDISGGHIVPLDLSKVEEYRLFSGQVVLVRGENSVGKWLKATEIVVPSPFPMPTILAKTTRPLNMIIACGPYTPTDSLLYEPLSDLIQVIKRDKPELCILMGPFIDESHDMVAAGEVAETFSEFFEKIVNNLKRSLADVKTHLVLVSNHKDVHHHPVYPTPRYSIKNKEKKITVLPDPAMIEVGGITIGMTSTDSLLHLAGSEMAKSTVSDRMAGLSRHILSQRNFYPLYPPVENVPFDVQLWYKYAKFTETPHLLVLPSELRHFIKDIDGTIVVNPEKLTKRKTGGTYAKLQINPDPLQKGNSIADFCCGEIIKI